MDASDRTSLSLLLSKVSKDRKGVILTKSENERTFPWTLRRLSPGDSATEVCFTHVCVVLKVLDTSGSFKG